MRMSKTIIRSWGCFFSVAHQLGTRSLVLLVSIAMCLPSLSWAFEPGIYKTSSIKAVSATKAIQIPGHLGTVVQASLAQERVVVHIQDLHCNYEVQNNIAEILEYLVREHKVSLVAEEGASLPINVSALASFPRTSVKRKVGQHCMRLGKLSGAEYFAAMSLQPIELRGMENQELYQESRKAVAAFFNEESQGYVYDLRAFLERYKAQMYSPELSRFDALKQAWTEGHLTLIKYAQGLSVQAKQVGVSLETYPVLRAWGNRLPGERAPLDTDRMAAECLRLDGVLRETLYTKPVQRELDQCLHRVEVMEHLLNISATPEEVADFNQHPEWYRVEGFLHFSEMNPMPDDEVWDGEWSKLDAVLDQVRRFYTLADQRSSAFVTNVLERMDGTRARMAVMVTGGFHTDKIVEALKQQGVGYITVRPSITHEDLVNPYFSLIRNRKTPLEKLLLQNQKVIALEPLLPQGIPTRMLTAEEERRQSVSVQVFLKSLRLQLSSAGVLEDVEKGAATLSWLQQLQKNSPSVFAWERAVAQNNVFLLPLKHLSASLLIGKKELLSQDMNVLDRLEGGQYGALLMQTQDALVGFRNAQAEARRQADLSWEAWRWALTPATIWLESGLGLVRHPSSPKAFLADRVNALKGSMAKGHPQNGNVTKALRSASFGQRLTQWGRNLLYGFARGARTLVMLGSLALAVLKPVTEVMSSRWFAAGVVMPSLTLLINACSKDLVNPDEDLIDAAQILHWGDLRVYLKSDNTYTLKLNGQTYTAENQVAASDRILVEQDVNKPGGYRLEVTTHGYIRYTLYKGSGFMNSSYEEFMAAPSGVTVHKYVDWGSYYSFMFIDFSNGEARYYGELAVDNGVWRIDFKDYAHGANTVLSTNPAIVTGNSATVPFQVNSVEFDDREGNLLSVTGLNTTPRITYTHPFRALWGYLAAAVSGFFSAGLMWGGLQILGLHPGANLGLSLAGLGVVTVAGYFILGSFNYFRTAWAVQNALFESLPHQQGQPRKTLGQRMLSPQFWMSGVRAIAWSDGRINQAAMRVLEKNAPRVAEEVRFHETFSHELSGMLAMLPGVRALLNTWRRVLLVGGMIVSLLQPLGSALANPWFLTGILVPTMSGLISSCAKVVDPDDELAGAARLFEWGTFQAYRMPNGEIIVDYKGHRLRGTVQASETLLFSDAQGNEVAITAQGHVRVKEQGYRFPNGDTGYQQFTISAQGCVLQESRDTLHEKSYFSVLFIHPTNGGTRYWAEIQSPPMVIFKDYAHDGAILDQRNLNQSGYLDLPTFTFSFKDMEDLPVTIHSQDGVVSFEYQHPAEYPELENLLGAQRLLHWNQFRAYLKGDGTYVLDFEQQRFKAQVQSSDQTLYSDAQGYSMVLASNGYVIYRQPATVNGVSGYEEFTVAPSGCTVHMSVAPSLNKMYYSYLFVDLSSGEGAYLGYPQQVDENGTLVWQVRYSAWSGNYLGASPATVVGKPEESLFKVSFLDWDVKNNVLGSHPVTVTRENGKLRIEYTHPFKAAWGYLGGVAAGLVSAGFAWSGLRVLGLHSDHASAMVFTALALFVAGGYFLLGALRFLRMAWAVQNAIFQTRPERLNQKVLPLGERLKSPAFWKTAGQAIAWSNGSVDLDAMGYLETHSPDMAKAVRLHESFSREWAGMIALLPGAEKWMAQPSSSRIGQSAFARSRGVKPAQALDSDETPATLSLRDLVSRGKLNEPLYSRHILAEMLYARQDVFGKQFDLMGQVYFKTGSRFDIRFVERNVEQARVSDPVKGEDTAVVIALPRYLAGVLHPAPSYGWVQQRVYAWRARQVRLELTRALDRYAEETRSLSQLVTLQNQVDYDAWENPVERLSPQDVLALGTESAEAYYRRSGGRTLGVPAASLGKVLELYRQMLCPGEAGLWSYVEPELQYLLKDGQPCSSALLVQAFMRVDADRIGDTPLRLSLIGLQKALKAAQASRQTARWEAEVNHLVELLLRSEQGLDAARLMPMNAAVPSGSEQQDEIQLLMDGVTQKALLKLVTALQPLAATPALQNSLNAIGQALAVGSLSLEQSAALEQVLENTALPEGRALTRLIGEDVSKHVGSMVNGRVHVQNIQSGGRSLELAIPVVADILAESARSVGAWSTLQQRVTCVRFTGRLPEQVPVTGNLASDLSTPLGGGVFAGHFLPEGALAQAYYRWHRQPSTNTNQRLVRVLIRMMKYAAREVEAGRGNARIFSESLEHLNQTLAQSPVFSVRVIGYWNSNPVYVPESLSYGGQLGYIALYEKAPGEFQLSEEFEDGLRKQRLRHFRAETAA